MSQAVFPDLPGLTWDITRTPVWSTTKKASVNLRQFRSANASYPLYRYKLSYEFLRQTNGYAEMAALAGFFNARRGSFDSFLWLDPDDWTVAGQTLGVADGSNVRFQLVRSFGGYVEPVFDANDLTGPPSIFDSGVARVAGTHYSISATGLVTFTAPPAAGHVITWSGSYYRRVCFVQDSAEFSKFMSDLWTLKTLELESVKP